MTKISVTISPGVCVIELNDPPANTYSYDMMREIDAAILGARMDPAISVILLTGAGEKFFCAGANIGMLKEADPDFKYYFCLHANETLTRLEQTPKLVIAALNGHTVGGGLEVALAADIRIAKKDAGKIGLPEVALGVLPGTGGTQRLARLVGKARAIDLPHHLVGVGVRGRIDEFNRRNAIAYVVTNLFGHESSCHETTKTRKKQSWFRAFVAYEAVSPGCSSRTSTPFASTSFRKSATVPVRNGNVP